MCDMTRSYVWHDSLTCITLLIPMCDMTRLYVWHDLHICVTWFFICVPWLVHDSLNCVTWLLHIPDITHSLVWHDSFLCVTWNVHRYDMTASYVWRGAFVSVTWLIRMRDMTCSSAWHDSFTRLSNGSRCKLPHTSFIRVKRLVLNAHWRRDSYLWHAWRSYDTYINESCHAHEWVMPHIHTYIHMICVEARWLVWMNEYDVYAVCVWVWHDFFVHSCMDTIELPHRRGSASRICRVRGCVAPRHQHSVMSRCVTWLVHTCNMTLLSIPRVRVCVAPRNQQSIMSTCVTWIPHMTHSSSSCKAPRY